MILLVADLRELKANPKAPASGTVLESRVDRGRGPVATVLVQNGTLNTGDVFICGAVFGKVRAMFDDKGASIKTAGPSTPVEVLGLQGIPGSWRSVPGNRRSQSSSPRRLSQIQNSRSHSRAFRRRSAHSRSIARAVAHRRSQGIAHRHQGRRAGFRRSPLGNAAETFQ